MEQYISKSALVAEIEKQRNAYIREPSKYKVLSIILSFIDTLEVKEIQEEPTNNELKIESYWENKYKEVLKQFKSKVE